MSTSHPCSLRWSTACRLQDVSRRDALLSWAAKLDPTWSFVVTLTFRHAIPSRNALTAGLKFARWASGWRNPVLQRGLFRCSLWSAEGHLTGNVHIHALSACTPLASVEHMRSTRPQASRPWRSCLTCESSRALGGVNPDDSPGEQPLWRRLKESWFVHHGIARVYPYNPTLRFGAERYITKYILDEKCLDWGVLTE